MFRSAVAYPTQAGLRRWRETLADGKVASFKAVSDGLACGTVQVTANELQTLYVLPEYWGQGLGSLLHRAATVEIANAGFRQAQLLVLQENRRARSFYERHGWRLLGRQGQSKSPPHPWVVRYTRHLA